MASSTPWKPAFFVATAALALSIALNVRASMQPPPPPPRCPDCPELHCPPPPACPPAAAASANSTCPAELAKCREEAWAVVARAMRQQPIAAPVPAPIASVEAPDAGAGGAKGTSAADQRRAFCDLAERSIRDQVQANRELIVASLRQVGTPDFVQQELPNTIERVKGALGLDDDKAAKLAPEYERLWRSHGEDLHAAFASEPFDDEAASRAVRSFWQDEDKMISGRYGPSALDTYRASQLQGRTAFLTIFASLGGKPFDAVASW